MYLKYRLYENSNNNTSNVLAEVLKNRGINDYEKYLNLNESVLIPYEKLENINKAVELFMKHFNNKDKIARARVERLDLLRTDFARQL